MRVPLMLVAAIGWTKTWSWSDDKIVGGVTVKNISMAPYSVAIQRTNSTTGVEEAVHQCMGSLLSALFVITTCRCVAEVNETNGEVGLIALPLENWLFVVGTLDVDYRTWSNDSHAQYRRPKFIEFHPLCNFSVNTWLSTVSISDVGIARMLNPFDLNDYVRPVEIFSLYPSVFKQHLLGYLGRRGKCTIAGWGSTEYRSLLEDIVDVSTTPGPPTTETAISRELKLKQMGVYVQGNRMCWKRMFSKIIQIAQDYVRPNYPWPLFISTLKNNLEDQMCIISESQSSPCAGDFGSGLICDDRYIIGVTSWGVGCSVQVPTVVQNLKNELIWLEQKLCAFSTCEDVQYAIPDCEPPDDDLARNCSIATTATSSMNPTTSTLYVTPAPASLVTRVPIPPNNSGELQTINSRWFINLAFYLIIKNSW